MTIVCCENYDCKNNLVGRCAKGKITVRKRKPPVCSDYEMKKPDDKDEVINVLKILSMPSSGLCKYEREKIEQAAELLEESI